MGKIKIISCWNADSTEEMFNRWAAQQSVKILTMQFTVSVVDYAVLYSILVHYQPAWSWETNSVD